MSNNAPAPAYGAVNNPPAMNPNYGPPPPAPGQAPFVPSTANPPGPTGYASGFDPAYPPVASQPGFAPPPQGFPSGPPPKYEASKSPMAGYQPPPAGYPAGYQGSPQYTQPSQQTVIVVQDSPFGQLPKSMNCHYCHATITTGLNYTTGGLTWLASGLICIFGCWAGCCLIPFCMPDLQDVEHVCPNCNRVVGIYRRL